MVGRVAWNGGGVGPRAQTCSWKTSRFGRENAHCDYGQQCYGIYFKIAKNLDLKCSYHKKEWSLWEAMEVLAKAVVAILTIYEFAKSARCIP